MPNQYKPTSYYGLASEFARMDQQTAVVTGSSSGIGRAIALELARAGANLVIHAGKNLAGAEETAAAVRQIGCEATVLLIDLSGPTGQDELVEAAWNWRNGIDVWINNAGADVLTGEAASLTFEEKLEVLWRIDVLATIRLSRAIGRRMLTRTSASETSQPSGVIINIGWDQVDTGMAGDSGEMFCAIKGAITSFTRSLARSLAPSVRVNCVAPGWIRTAWGDQASEYWQNRAKSESLRGRWGRPEDVAQMVRYLVSPSADFITGQVLAANGGQRPHS